VWSSFAFILAQQEEKYISDGDNEQLLKKFPPQEWKLIMVFGNQSFFCTLNDFFWTTK